ncbi:hypothetical protein [Halomonas sp. TD01]|uniref:hypothetical protein n=1 Tax=Halomonas sp. TD01 TaxID=999141 RepID=UPI000214E29F|nr:hypothetical protein [Halomonas sp. TD01]EGP20163.1 hypothetical protein GME_08074 [Halomonas sp. TD01]CAH1043166.1 hypothetical protein HPTD01_1644 [Halomonas sp. TD01]
MAIGAPNHSLDAASHVALVLFSAGHTLAAIEARHIAGLAKSAHLPRCANAECLLLNAPLLSVAPTHWLTLQDAKGAWQLGVTGDVVLAHTPITELFPLPSLVASRHVSPALRGLTLANQTVRLLFDGAALNPALALQP